jgi:two-component sensor histidine kinase
LRPYDHFVPGSPTRFSIGGPPIRCADHAINGLALVVHELATNAAKYGALTTAEGKIDVDWRQENDSLKLRWEERHGRPVEAPSTAGFGTSLVRTMIVKQFGGTVAYDWQPGGVSVEIVVPVQRLSW